MDELGAIRKDLAFGCLVNYPKNPYYPYKTFIYFERGRNYILDVTNADWDYEEDVNEFEVIGHPPVLSDLIEAIHKAIWEHIVTNDTAQEVFFSLFALFDFTKPYLKDQSDELWEKLWELIKP